MGWSHCPLPGNPWQQLLLSHFLDLGGRVLETVSPWKAPVINAGRLACVSDTPSIMNAAHSAPSSVFEARRPPAASCLRPYDTASVALTI